MTRRALIDRLRQPAYTGENRCLPCTVLNTLISLAISVLLASVWLPLGVLTFLACVGLIYIRGYVVPYTPTITQRYFPDRLLRWFGKQDAGPSTSLSTRSDTANDSDAAVDIEALLRDGTVVVDCPDEDDLCLSDAFEAAWWRRIRRLREHDPAARERLAAVIDVDPDALAFDDGTRFSVTYEGDPIGAWESEAAFYADLAVEPTLDEWLAKWAALSDHERTQLIAGMRAFLDRCPRCEESVEQAENIRKTCCSSTVVGVDVDCPACGARVFSGRY